jgi:tetratricopeptide (TPR) repeat protein
VLAVTAALLPARAGVAGDQPLWTDAARAPAVRAARLSMEAGLLATGDRLADAEARLRAAASLRPDDPTPALALAEVEAALGHDAAAVATLERTLAHAADDAAAWVRLGALRAKLGRFPAAAAAYGAALAAGASAADVYGNLAEVLMADGRLGEAEARYREAIAVSAGEVTGERRPRAQDLALAYYGLAVALDRDDQRAAAREMIARALAQDPGASLLKVASSSNGDLFFVPDGDVFYYLGLAAEAEGRATDAEAAFREFLARGPAGRWAHAAAAHLDGAAEGAGPGGGGRAGAARVVAVGTIEASGGIAAPLVDAAWRGQLGLLDDCLGRARGQGSVRFAIELEIDGRGQIARAVVKAPPPLDDAFARCAEGAVRRGLRVSVPAGSKPTRARSELIVVFP